MGAGLLRGDVLGRQGQPRHHQRERVLLRRVGCQRREEGLQAQGEEMDIKHFSVGTVGIIRSYCVFSSFIFLFIRS